MELQPLGYAPGLSSRKGLVKRCHPMRVQIVENQPNHRDVGVGLIHHPPHLVSEVLHGALPGYRHVAPAAAGLAGEEQVQYKGRTYRYRIDMGNRSWEVYRRLRKRAIKRSGA